MIDDPLFYALALPAVLIAGISKGGYGGGLVIMSVPLMSWSIDPRQAAAIMLPLLCFMDLFGLASYRKAWDKPNLKMLLPAGVLGVVAGTLTFHLLSTQWIRLVLGLIALGFTLNHWFGGRKIATQKPISAVTNTIWGSIAGFTSFVAHAGGPALSVALLPQKLDKTIFVGTTIIFFTVSNYLKIGAYLWLGQFSTQNLITSAVLIPLAALGMWAGLWLHHRTNERAFYRICYLLLFVTGIKLLYDGLIPLWV